MNGKEEQGGGGGGGSRGNQIILLPTFVSGEAIKLRKPVTRTFKFVVTQQSTTRSTERKRERERERERNGLFFQPIRSFFERASFVNRFPEIAKVLWADRLAVFVCKMMEEERKIKQRQRLVELTVKENENDLFELRLGFRSKKYR